MYQFCLLTQFDAKDAYKQLYIWVADLNQQIFEIDGLFFVDWCAVFGSLYGNDIYSAFGNAHCRCLSAMASTPFLRVYVDNYINITPFLTSGKRTMIRALEETARLVQGLRESGLK